MTSAYPLQWPMGRPRTKSPRVASFNKKVDNGRYTETKHLTVADALSRLQKELDMLRAGQYVLSSNLETRLDGMPRSGQAEPRDSGVALYFQLGGQPHCLPCDTYIRVADNIAAIAKHIDATRAIERYGVASVKEMFSGFVSLPSPSQVRPWWQILGVSEAASEAEITAAFRDKAKSSHPDGGGSHDHMAELNAARDAGLKARKSS